LSGRKQVVLRQFEIVIFVGFQVGVSRKDAKKGRTQGAREKGTQPFAPYAFLFLAPLRETPTYPASKF
jgi:hypothetical protein